MQKVDLKKSLKNLYDAPTKEVVLVEVPALNYAMIDGSGDPNQAQEYQDAIEALYAISYSLKFTIKKEKEIDYGVMPLEGLWWTNDMSLFSLANKNIWKWTAMIMQPEYVTKALFDSTLQQIKKKKNLPALSKARFQNLSEGRSAQIMYIGPFTDEGPTVDRIHQFIRNQGYSFDGLLQKHHEIYLSDFRKTAAEKLKTIIRQPCQT